MFAPTTRRLAFAACTLVFGSLLVACGGSGGTSGATAPPAEDSLSATGNTVTASAAPAGPVQVIVGQSRSVAITFAASEGRQATGLRVTSALAGLPAGWSSASTEFTCATVGQDGACKLDLTYAPTAAAPSGTLTLDYAYTDSAGQARTGSFALGYQAAAASAAYIVNFDDHNVRRCEIGADGAFADCMTAADGSLFRPTAVAFNGSTAYVLSDGTDSIVQCDVGATGAFDNCRHSGVYGLDNPYGMAIHGSYVYVANTGNDTVSWCVIGADGGLGSDCRGSGDAEFGVPFNLAVHGSRLYVVNTQKNVTGALTVCDLEADGAFANCRDSGASLLNRPEGLAIAGSFAYLTNYNGRTVTRCTLGSDGSASACSTVATTAWSASGIAVSGPHAYITQSDDSVIHCDVAADGSLRNCSDAGASGMTTPLGITLR